jgi:ubiquinone/menaquinone biosynthesis C-methylase UbiE
LVEAAAFWDKTAEKYAKAPIKDMAAYEATLARVRAHLTPETEALEIGCGTGTTALKLAGAAKYITASDISAEMIAIAQGKAASEGVLNVDFLKATLDDHPFTEEQFGAVMAFNLLHLIEDIEGALRRVHGLLKPGGLFISKTACLGDRMVLFRLLLPVMQAFGRAPYVRFFKTAELDGMIEAAGFELIETGYYPEKARARFVVARKR